MNYLAHAYLSFDDPELLIGNLIGDFVRGKQIESFDPQIKQGILIHREIDSYTDNHPINKEIKNVFRESAGRYDATFLDIAYDHFLAKDPINKPSIGWKLFTKDCYIIIDKQSDILPDTFKRLYKHIKYENWLYNYRYKWMIRTTFYRMKKYRMKYLSDEAKVYEAFDTNYHLIQEAYSEFFPDLKQHIQSIIQNHKPL